MNFKGLLFGIPKEILPGERRVAAIPETVRKIISEGGKVLIEKGAGEGSYISDDDYKAAGAETEEDVERIYEQSDVILKVKEPQFNRGKEKHEVFCRKDHCEPGPVAWPALHRAVPPGVPGSFSRQSFRKGSRNTWR